MPIGAHSAKEMKGGQKYHRQAFATSQSCQIPRLGLFGGGQEVGDLDGEKEGGCAADSDSRRSLWGSRGLWRQQFAG